jgi:hypothetical protein
VVYGKEKNNIITNFPAYYISDEGKLEILVNLINGYDTFNIGFTNRIDKIYINTWFKIEHIKYCECS